MSQPDNQYAGTDYTALNCLGCDASEQTMAQPHLQYPPRLESHVRTSRWAPQESPVQIRHLPATPPSSAEFNGLPHIASSWGTDLGGREYPGGWHDGVQPEPYTASDAKEAFQQNGGLTYEHMAADHAMSKTGGVFGFGAFGSGLNYYPRTVSGQGTDLDGDDTASSFSNSIERAESSFSPRSIPGQTSLVGIWTSMNTSASMGAIVPPAVMVPELESDSLPSRSLKSDQDTDPIGFSAMDPDTTATANSHRDGCHVVHSMPISFAHRGEYSSPQGSDPTAVSWFPPGYSGHLSNLPVRTRDTQSPQRTYLIPTTSGFTATFDHDQNRPKNHAWLSSREDEASRPVPLLPRPTFPQSVSAQSQRKMNDDILVKGKRDGLTYKEIRRQLVGEKPAESTLRGRFRTLTKERKDRVRKPKWDAHDKTLLEIAVERELERVNSTTANPYALSNEARLTKVSWKAVASYIINNGGSYGFGNSTCKKMWLQLHPEMV